MKPAIALLCAIVTLSAAPLRAQAPPGARMIAPDSAFRVFRGMLVVQARAAARAAVQDPHGLVILSGGGRGRLDLELMHANVPESALRAVQERARTGFALFGRDSAVIAFRLEEGPELGGALGVGDPPQVANWPQTRTRIINFVAEHDTELYAGQSTRVELAILVTKEGEVGLVRVTNPNGMAVVDQGAIAIARAMRFHPARVAGEPVDMIITFPLEFSDQGG